MRRYLRRLWSALWGVEGDVPVASKALGRWETEQERYDVLDAYRANDDLYGRLKAELKIYGYERYQNIRNPANRLIEFYAAKLPDALYENLDTGEDEGLKELIKKINEWSNWKDRSEVCARNFTAHGDLFIKVENSEDRAQVRKNLLDPRHVTDYDKDARGQLTYLRLDIPQEERAADEVREYTRTEVWDKPSKRYFVIEHEEGEGTSLEDLPAPKFSALLTAEPPDNPETRWTGYDFIPVVHRKLKDTGGERGEGVFQHALDGIDQANYLATKLFQMLFPDVTWKLTRQPGPGGMQLGPVRVEQESPQDQQLSRLTRSEQESFAVVEEGNQRTLRLPAGADLAPLVPPLDFESHLAALDSHMADLEKDLPELAYYRLREMDEISGRAARILLGDVADRFNGARSKFEDAEVRANKMALTIGRVLRIEGFAALPEDAYESGALEHSFGEYEVFPLSPAEKAEADVAEANALAGWKELGPVLYAKKLEERGYEPEEARRIAEDAGSPRDPIEDLLTRSNLR